MVFVVEHLSIPVAGAYMPFSGSVSLGPREVHRWAEIQEAMQGGFYWRNFSFACPSFLVCAR